MKRRKKGNKTRNFLIIFTLFLLCIMSAGYAAFQTNISITATGNILCGGTNAKDKILADNLISRDFEADKPNKKWYTDVTEFNLRGEKIYLSPIINGFNQEVKSYDISKSPNLEQINRMLNIGFEENTNLKDLIFHSDQGWQYQHQSYQQQLKNKGIRQSMFRKGNSMDNGLMENFFGILKTEMFYDQEDNYNR